MVREGLRNYLLFFFVLMVLFIFLSSLFYSADYIQCPYCSRRFNESAAQRHIDFCKEQSARLPKNKPSATATSRFKTRTQVSIYMLIKSFSRKASFGERCMSRVFPGYFGNGAWAFKIGNFTVENCLIGKLFY